MKYLSFLIISILLVSCNNNDVFIDPVDLEKWNDEISNRSGLSRVLMNSAIHDEELKVRGMYGLYTFDENGIVQEFITGTNSSIYVKNAFSHNLTTTFYSSENNIAIVNTKYNFSNARKVQLNFWGNNNLPFDKFNYGHEIGAFNENNVFLTSVQDSSDLDVMKLFMLKCNPIFWGVESDSTYGYKTIQLPIESSNEVHRMQSFGNQFFVSTNNNAYLVKEDATYQQIFNHTIHDFFEYNGKIYADNGDNIYSTTDGITWNIEASALNYTGFRQFFTANNNLYCFDDDQLFAVNPTDFSLTTISNRNLEGKKITSAIVYNHKVWLTTLDGLFTRNIENF